MADDDIGALGFCSYRMVLSQLTHELDLSEDKAHRLFCRAVKMGELRLRSNPDERPEFDIDYWIPLPYAAPPTNIFAGSGLYPEETHFDPPPRHTPRFKLEEYSIADLDRLTAKFPGEKKDARQQATLHPSSSGGRPEDYPWENIALCFGALLWDERAGNNQEGRITKIQEIARLLTKREPSRSTIQPRLKRWLEAYERFKEQQNAGN